MLKKWFKKLEESIGKDDENQRKKLPWILGLGLVGILLLVFSSFHVKEKIPDEEEAPLTHTVPSKTSMSGSSISSMQDYERYYEVELAQILGKIVGVDDVSLKVNLDSSEEEVLAQDTRQTEQVTSEADKRGGNRSVSQNSNDRKTAYYRGENGEKPVIIKN
jgi:stage III sporulation protein AG